MICESLDMRARPHGHRFDANDTPPGSPHEKNRAHYFVSIMFFSRGDQVSRTIRALSVACSSATSDTTASEKSFCRRHNFMFAFTTAVTTIHTDCL